MTPDLFWIPGHWRGKLAVSTRPRGGDWLEGEVTGWRDMGLDTVVSLLEPDEAAELGLKDEGEILASKGMRFLPYPIPDRCVPASQPDALSLLADIIGELATGRNVAVHCRQGVGRSGLIAAASLVISGLAVGEAVDVVSRARGVAVPETNEQLQWLKRLAAERQAVAS